LKSQKTVCGDEFGGRGSKKNRRPLCKKQKTAYFLG